MFRSFGFCLFAAIVAISSQSNAGLITAVVVDASDTDLIQVDANNFLVKDNGSFFVDFFVQNGGTGSTTVGYFDLKLTINAGSGIIFAPIATQISSGMHTTTLSSANYLLADPPGPSLGGNQRRLSSGTGFFYNRAADGRSIDIRDGVVSETSLGSLPPPPTTQQVTVTSQKLLARVLVQSTSVLQGPFNFNIAANAGNSALSAGANEGQSFNFNGFGFWTLDVNNNGVGNSYGSGTGNSLTFTPSSNLTAVPEPSSMALLGLASLGGLGARYRAWRKKRAA